MKRTTSIGIIFLGLIVFAWADTGEKARARITASADVVKDIFNAPDKGVPLSVLDGTKCVIVIPDLKKAAFIIGGDYGRGVMTCRTGEDFKGPWSAPIMMASGGADIGFQLGVEGTDVVILVLNDEGARSIMKSKVKLGAEASVAAGPVGRTQEASTNEVMKAQMLSYSRARGLFAGVSVSGMTLRVDGDADENLYREKVRPQQILKGEGIAMPDEAKPLIAAIQQATAKAAELEK
ncbi:MAG TPA: lipid-binding SYLF domain-containing protein [Terriglobales bacterium]|jgi:lipid-binding SYLF domain-containing protein|nr:lipid-binding SYLF domain-containing protein [Terriglobales bacterium]